MRFGVKLAFAAVISPPKVSVSSGCYPPFSSEANYGRGSLVSFSRVNYECVGNLLCRCTGNQPSGESDKDCWKILGFCSKNFVNFPEKCPLPFDFNVHYYDGDSILVNGNSVYKCKPKPNGSYCNNYESETFGAIENSDWIYRGRCEIDSTVSSHHRKVDSEDDPLTEENNPHRFTGSFHLAIFEEKSTPMRGMLDDSMDGVVLEFLRDNGVRNHCEAILVHAKEQTVYEQRVKSVQNIFVVSNVLEMELSFVVEDVSEEDDDNVGNKGGNPCTPKDLCLCCASASISSNPGKYCKKLGCNLDDCARKASMGEDRRRRLRSLEEDLSGQHFLNVVKKYTSFKPIGLAVVLNATDTDDVATCGANRFIDDNFLKNSFTCDVYDENDCANNEDIIFNDVQDVCYTDYDLFV